MNSPVPCLPDPIQNMKKKTVKSAKKRSPQRKKLLNSSRTAAPAAYGAVLSGRDTYPLVAGTGSSMIVQNYELVHELTAGGGAFTAGGDVLNPGLSGNFPWLSHLAQNYSKFRWISLRYIYVPACSTASAGVEWLYFKYDYLDNAPASLSDVMASDTSCMGNVWFGQPINDTTAFSPRLPVAENVNVDLDVDKLTRDWYYVRTGNNANQPVTTTLGGVVPGGLTVSTNNIYDDVARPGIIYYGNSGTAGSALNGYLFAAYTVEFCEPTTSSINS